MVAAATFASSPALNILINYVFPITGSVLGFILSVTPIRAVRVRRRCWLCGCVHVVSFD
jgi:hypothetical protein